MKLIVLTILLVIVSAGLAAGGTLSEAELAPRIASLFPDDSIAGEFKYLYDQLDEAVAIDNDRAAEAAAQSMVLLIRVDLEESSGRVRELARRVTVNGRPLPDSTGRVDDGGDPYLNNLRLLFSHSLEFLNAKEQVYRRLQDKYDLRYRYRLLGDYWNLLRRELNMPRLQLASTAGPGMDR